MSMQRFTSGLIPLIVDTTLADSEELPMGSYAGGAFVPGTSVTSVAFYGALERGGTFYEIKDSSNTAVTRTVTAGDAYALPDECFGFAAIKLVPNTDSTVLVCLKS